MSIVAECPHCESRFTLSPELAGKAMRCPNVDCREPFIVREIGPAAAPPSSPPPPPKAPETPAFTSGAVADFLPVIEAELAPANGTEPPPTKSKKARPKPPEPTEVVDAALVAPPPVREVVWSPDAELPGAADDVPRPPDPTPPPARPKPRRAEESRRNEPRPGRRRQKKKSRRGRFVLFGMLLLLPALIFAGWWYRERAKTQAEEQLRNQAQTAYTSGDFANAARSYEQLAAGYPGSPAAEKYRFFAAVATLRGEVGSAANRKDPRPAVELFRTFLAEHKDSPLLQPEGEGQPEVLAAGLKIIEDVAGFAEDRVAAFRGSRSNTDELTQAEGTIQTGRELLDQLQPYRGTDPGPDRLKARLDTTSGAIVQERKRLATLAGLRPRLAKPNDEVIEAAWAELDAAGLRNDTEAAAMVRDAASQLGRQVRYEVEQVPPRPPPEVPLSHLFVTPIGRTRPPLRGIVGDVRPGVFLAVANGLVYALDEDTGHLLWAVRVGPDMPDPPAVARVDLPEGPTDIAVVTSNAGKPGVAAYDLRTGQPRWFQQLPAPPAGPAVVVGQRGYVPVKDPEGSLYEFELASGVRVGRITLAQRVGPGVLRPGTTGLLYLVADARRLFVLDLDGRDAEKNRLPPRCVQVLNTGHPPGTVRTPPIFVGPTEPDDSPENRWWLVLTQAAGPTESNLRVFALPPVPPPAADGLPPPAGPAELAAEYPIPGWVWFPPTSDGERVAVATDAGHVRLFAVKQPGNTLDRQKVLLPLPDPETRPPANGGPARGLVIPAPDRSFWVLAGGADLRRVRLTLNPNRGQVADTFPAASPTASGVPTQPARVNDRRDTAFLVVRSAGSAGFRAVAVDLATGETRWQRQLGMVPAAAPVPGPSGMLIVEEDGGIAAVPPEPPKAAMGNPWAVGSDRIVAPSHDGASGPTAVAVSADGGTVFTVTPVRRGGTDRFEIRKVVGGRVERTAAVPAPGAPAGPPAAFGDSLLLPTADGSVHRLVWAGLREGGRLVRGPRWSGDRLDPDGLCFVTALGGDRFLTTDGGRNLARWVWPQGGQPQPDGTVWTVPERVAVPAVVVPVPAGGGGLRVLVADASGSVWLYPVDLDDRPLRRWRPEGKGVSGAKPVSAIVVQMGPTDRPVVAYAVEGGAVICLEPDAEDVRYVMRSRSGPGGAVIGPPQPAGKGRWVVTDLGGRVRVVDPEVGRESAFGEVNLAGTVPAAAGVMLDPGRVLIPLSDGSAVVVHLRELAPEPRATEG